MPDLHLTDDQLSAQLDGALEGAQADAAAAHLESCESCRARFADLAALETHIEKVLAHDPGDAYFASFAERVSAKIATASAPAGAARAAAAAAAAAPATRATPSRPWWQGLFTPRGMMLAGAAAAFVIVAVLAVQLSSHGPQDMALRSGARSELKRAPGAATPEPATPSDAEPKARALSTPAPMRERATAGPKDAAPGAATDELARKESENEPFAPRLAHPGRAQEVRTLENGEQVPVSRGPDVARRAEQAPQLDASGTLRKPRAMPMGAQGFAAPPAPVTVQRSLASTAIRPLEKQRDDKLAAPLPAATGNSLAPRSGGAQPARDEDSGAPAQAAVRLCGRVADAQGRAIAGAIVTLADAGASATSEADGAFCLDAPAPSGTVLVFAVGYEPYRYTMHGEARAQALSVTLAPVPTLGSSSSDRAARFFVAPAPGVADPFEGVTSNSARLAVAGAQKADAAAVQAHTAGAWSFAAANWTQAAALLEGTAANEARFRAAAARMQVLPLAPDAVEPLAAARAALQAYLALAPAGARREQAQRWWDSIKR